MATARRITAATLAIPFLIVVAVLVASSLFIVDEREKALVLRLGRVVDVKEEPGLGFKVPFLDNVEKYDGRILGLPTVPLEVTPLDDRRLIVDAFARWRITDVVRFRQAVGAGGIQGAQGRLEPIVRNAIREVLGTVPSTSVLSDDRTALMNQIRDEAVGSPVAAADHVASHAEFGQTRPSHLDVEVTKAGPRGNRLDPRGTRIELRRWCVLYYHVSTRCRVPWDGEAAAAADPAV